MLTFLEKTIKFWTSDKEIFFCSLSTTIAIYQWSFATDGAVEVSVRKERKNEKTRQSGTNNQKEEWGDILIMFWYCRIICASIDWEKNNNLALQGSLFFFKGMELYMLVA